jgi:hypothetical protein
VQPLFPLSLRGSFRVKLNHGGTEDTEVAQRKPKQFTTFCCKNLTLLKVACYFLASNMKKLLLVVAVIALYILHQDIWFWRSSYLVFGFIPIGLFYQACFSVAAALLMWLLVTFAWPAHLEQEVEETNIREDAVH